MRILWIPHGTWERKIRQRDQYFIEKLKEKHEIHILIWTEPKGPEVKYFLNPAVHFNALREWSKKNEVNLHHYRRLCFSRFKNLRSINEKFFQKKIRKIVKDHEIDVVICGPNEYLNGFPPFDLKIPLVFDYLDYVSDESVRKTYLKNCDAVLCVSNSIFKEAESYVSNSYYLSNGVDLKKFEKVNPKKVRSKYGLEDARIVSLIGITCSKNLHFLDAFPVIKKQIKDLVYLIVGDSYLLPKMMKKTKRFSKDIIFTGWVEYKEIQDYYAATDVGIHPVGLSTYFDCQSPLKVFEYTAANKPVVSTYTKELEFLNFPNVLLSKPNAEDFSRKVVEAFNTDVKLPDLKKYDWKVLTKRLEDILEEILVKT